ncbi:MAG: hypothetical protein HAW66_05905 [Shewanella sp.]|nr:hypothetical protein [Shewanella sp.]
MPHTQPQAPTSPYEAVGYANSETVTQNPNNNITKVQVVTTATHSPIQHVYTVQPPRDPFARLVRYLCCRDLREPCRPNRVCTVQRTQTVTAVYFRNPASINSREGVPIPSTEQKPKQA